MACFDTSFILDLMGKGGAKREARADTLLRDMTDRGDSLTTTRFTVAELSVGVHLASDPGWEKRRIQAALRDFQILEFDSDGAERFGLIQALLRKTGQLIGDFDVLIAAVCLQYDETLVTANPGHFQRVPNLRIETY